MDRVFIIAEAGVNHNGDPELAKQLVDEAVSAGADAVKFQTFQTEKLVAPDAPMADYQRRSNKSSETQFAMLKRLELDLQTHKELLTYCRKREILFLSTPFDLESIDLLNELGMNLFKIPSGEITNLPYLRKIGNLGKPIIMSTGMADLQEIGAALSVLEKTGTPHDDITVLHCTTEYPAPIAEVNLRAMNQIATTYNVKVGYSDHTLGIEVPIAAVALGATIVEKHFTLDRTLPGPDHRASLEPEEFAQMVVSIRNVEKALGDGIKQPTPSEAKNRLIARKSLVAAQAISKGAAFSEKNLTVKRPGGGINPMEWDRIIGTTAKQDYAPSEKIVEE